MFQKQAQIFIHKTEMFLVSLFTVWHYIHLISYVFPYTDKVAPSAIFDRSNRRNTEG